jgi:hypothetical protein
VARLILPFIWYTSDLFYWLLYFGSFLNSNNNMNINLNEEQKEQKVTNLFILSEYFMLFNHMAIKSEQLLLKLTFISALIKKINLKFCFKILAIFFLIGSFGKFYLNLNDCFKAFHQIVQMDKLVKETAAKILQ